MNRQKNFRRVLGALVVASAFCGAPATAGDSPVVVELFTSQGCSSCPPAEKLLGELARRDDVVALEFHVDYWDYIGWVDPFAQPAFDDRQEGYVRSLRKPYKYTPQMVINGAVDAVGSHRNRVEKAIKLAKAKAAGSGPDVMLRREGDTLEVMIGGAKGSGDYDIILVTYDHMHATFVARGENGGRKLINSNVVRAYEMIGEWNGEAVTHSVSLKDKPGNGGCAVIVQERDYGRIAGAAKLSFVN